MNKRGSYNLDTELNNVRCHSWYMRNGSTNGRRLKEARQAARCASQILRLVNDEAARIEREIRELGTDLLPGIDRPKQVSDNCPDC